MKMRKALTIAECTVSKGARLEMKGGEQRWQRY